MAFVDPLEGIQPWLRPYAEYALMWMQYQTGGQVRSGWYAPYIEGGVTPKITSVRRDLAQQEELYAHRDTNPYPVNRPGDSPHQYGLAFDSSVPSEYWPLWTSIRTAVGWRVPDNDRVHAEVPGWRSLLGTSWAL